MLKPLNPVIPKEYADRFRQNDANMSTGGGRGAPVAPPCVIKHPIGSKSHPEIGANYGFPLKGK